MSKRKKRKTRLNSPRRGKIDPLFPHLFSKKRKGKRRRKKGGGEGEGERKEEETEKLGGRGSHFLRGSVGLFFFCECYEVLEKDKKKKKSAGKKAFCFFCMGFVYKKRSATTFGFFWRVFLFLYGKCIEKKI